MFQPEVILPCGGSGYLPPECIPSTPKGRTRNVQEMRKNRSSLSSQINYRKTTIKVNKKHSSAILSQKDETLRRATYPGRITEKFLIHYHDQCFSYEEEFCLLLWRVTVRSAGP
ncbi:hypothetical protein RvY_13319 [Ramazzottius varieornatus]|uniref:Uncharacterized protein n=1 Tax=Ramazzottius varieornatus TaxID=947166 RepID=A0A1D1VMI0_RAMVA|nr:hypothetical protein RvY_13319 [Ramazzottius varieornatus]